MDKKMFVFSCLMCCGFLQADFYNEVCRCFIRGEQLPTKTESSKKVIDPKELDERKIIGCIKQLQTQGSDYGKDFKIAEESLSPQLRQQLVNVVCDKINYLMDQGNMDAAKGWIEFLKSNFNERSGSWGAYELKLRLSSGDTQTREKEVSSPTIFSLPGTNPWSAVFSDSRE